jgi:hypothetical protein
VILVAGCSVALDSAHRNGCDHGLASRDGCWPPGPAPPRPPRGAFLTTLEAREIQLDSLERLALGLDTDRSLIPHLRVACRLSRGLLERFVLHLPSPPLSFPLRMNILPELIAHQTFHIRAPYFTLRHCACGAQLRSYRTATLLSVTLRDVSSWRHRSRCVALRCVAYSRDSEASEVLFGQFMVIIKDHLHRRPPHSPYSCLDSIQQTSLVTTTAYSSISSIPIVLDGHCCSCCSCRWSNHGFRGNVSLGSGLWSHASDGNPAKLDSAPIPIQLHKRAPLLPSRWRS